jgi:IS5 family transposase
LFGSSANFSDITSAATYYMGQTDRNAHSGYQEIEKRYEADASRWNLAMGPGKRKKLDLNDRPDVRYAQIERIKAGIPANIECPSCVVRREFGYTNTGIKN